MLLLATAAFFRLGQTWWLFLLLPLAPDLSLLGLLAGPRAGALVYNAVHTMVGPLALLGGGWWLGGRQSAALAVALVWPGHIGLKIPVHSRITDPFRQQVILGCNRSLCHIRFE